MNILLIQTGISQELQKSMGQGNVNRINMPMLGLLYIEASTPKDNHVDIIDENNELIENYEPYDIVGISGMTMHANRMYFLASEYKKLGCYIVLGGVHVSFMLKEALQYADTVIVGEGEVSWRKFICDYKNNEPKKVYYPESLIKLRDLPKPKLNLVDGLKYHAPAGTLNSIIATRGCPNNCSFCCVGKMFNNKYRVRPVDMVIDDFNDLDKNIVIFQDDNIVGNQIYAKELFAKMIPLHRKWGGQGSINVANNDEVLYLLEQSGCSTLFIGFESINPKNIEVINKGKVNKTYLYEEQIKKIHDRGIKIFGSFIVGFDDDQESVFDDIYEFVVKNKIDFPIINCLTPFPGTDLFNKLNTENRIIDFNWEKYSLTNVVIRPKKMSPDKLQFKYNSLSYYLSKFTVENLNSLI